MFFSVGVETPKDDQTAYGITVPAFDCFGFGCVSAADRGRYGIKRCLFC